MMQSLTKFTNSINSEETIKRSVDLSIGLLVVILNIMEITLILRIKHQRLFEIILLSLSVADLLYGLTNASLCIVFLGNLYVESVVNVTFTLYFFFVLTSICHLMFIAVDRLWAVVRPITHNVLMTRKKVYIALGTVWSLTIAITFALILSYETDQLFDDEFVLEQIVTDTLNPNTTSSIVSLSTTNSTIFNTTTTTLSAKTSPITEIVSNVLNGTTPLTTIIALPSNKTNTPIFQKTLLMTKEEKYKDFVQHLLAGFIIGADILLIFLYALIIYRVRASNQNSQVKSKSHHSTNKVGLVCIFVAASFVLFTIPYGLKTFVSGDAGFWTNIILVGNSGMNSVIYFFKNRCERAAKQKQRMKDLTALSSIVSTPLPSRNPSETFDNTSSNELQISHTRL